MMKIDITDTRDYLIDKLQENDLKYEVHTFESRAIIIDIWINDRFYVAQIDTDNLGISEIKDEQSGWDIKPEREFSTFKDFKTFVEAIIPS